MIVTTLAVLVPVGFVAGLAARVPPATMERLPAPLASPRSEGPALWEQEDLWPASPITTRGIEGGVVQLTAREPLGLPDLLVYWTADDVDGDALPAADVTLLGSLGAGEGTFSPPATGGALLLYSLAHQTIVDRARLPAGADG